MKEENTYYDGMDGLNLPGSLRVNPFVVPENYFSHLTEHIQFHVKMGQYKDVVPNEWAVPPGYFEDLPNKILAQTKIETVRKHKAFDVPAGYFETLSERIQSKIFEDKLKQQVPADGFILPENYIGILKDKIFAQTAGIEKRKTPVRRLKFTKWIPYVAAACIAIVIGVVSYNTGNKMPEVGFTESHLASIPNEEIVNYLTALNDSDDMLYVIECIDHTHDHDAEGICTHVKENDIEDYLNYAL